MILIITNNNDQVTSRICLWLLHYKRSFKIISDDDDVDIMKIENESLVIKNLTRDYTLDMKDVRKILYRQGDIILSRNIPESNDINLSGFLKREKRSLQEFLYYKLRQMDHLGHPQYADLNKLIILEKALQFNLMVPEYMFTSSRSDLISFHSRHQEIITKTILPGYYYERDNFRYGSYTELLSQEDIQKFKTSFHPTFFQKFVRKKMDVRVFYVDRKFYSVAIMSQNNSETKIDFRIYDTEFRNRNISFQLPETIENSLQDLVSHLNLNYCSVDLVYGEDKKFYFLEINPIGQFGNVSYFGNYYLEKRMAKVLCA